MRHARLARRRAGPRRKKLSLPRITGPSDFKPGITDHGIHRIRGKLGSSGKWVRWALPLEGAPTGRRTQPRAMSPGFSCGKPDKRPEGPQESWCSEHVEHTGCSRAPSERELDPSGAGDRVTQGCRPGLESCGPSGLSFSLSPIKANPTERSTPPAPTSPMNRTL